jgi:hypothetical protein
VLFVDKHTSVVCPELLYLQLADTLTLPQLVLFGHELCGHYSYAADDPVHKKAICQIPSATSVENLNSFLSQFTQARGLAKAKEALPYVRDHALSVPETIMSTMYSLPVAESGYQMGPVTLNERIQQDGSDDQKLGKTRYPDLLFPFAPVGINYDGVDHLDLDGIADAAKATVSHDSMTAQTPQDSKDASDDEENELKKDAQTILQETIARVRGKALDDNSRNRELAARGYIVLPATKEDLYSISALDTLTRLILHCAKNIFDIDVAHFEKQLDDTELTRDRANLLASLTKWNSM